MINIKYDTSQYNFSEIYGGVVGMDSSWLHMAREDSLEIPKKPGEDQKSKFHKAYYGNCKEGSLFHDTYVRFINEFISQIFLRDEFIYQKIPTFRAHLPGNVSVAEYHKDSVGLYAHNPHEINFFLPLTPAFGTNTIWIESEPDLGDYRPMVCEYGEVIMFDGANLMHGNKINSTGWARLSVDFRILPKRFYNEANIKKSVGTGVDFSIGGYFSELSH